MRLLGLFVTVVVAWVGVAAGGSPVAIDIAGLVCVGEGYVLNSHASHAADSERMRSCEQVVPRAEVTVLGADGREFVTTTDADGLFRLKGVVLSGSSADRITFQSSSSGGFSVGFETEFVENGKADLYVEVPKAFCERPGSNEKASP